ncbi:MAG: replication restart helicase PriA, partial [Candidatus Saccharimonadales bacterium]
LHGDTGSGKTRLYIELTEKTLKNGKSAIILTPEIGLTAQLAQEFKASFGDRVIITHSQLTPAERRRTWQQLLTATQPLVVIGPRSALFSPLNNIGLIVIDESHDGSYKQNDAPHYSAITTAAKLAELSSCPLILGSATPSINDYFMAKSRVRPILRLSKPAIKTTQSQVRLIIIDIKERNQFKRSQLLSEKLIEYCEEALARKEQILLFLNRRGTARVTICADCGWNAVCPHCNLPLTYHGDTHLLRCHSCNYHQLPVSKCPNCGSSEINFKGSGTKAIEVEVKKLFPKAVTRRFDNDNPKRDRLEQAYDQLKSGKVDIIVGTQAVAKGLDLPKLTVVGVITADISLYLPDFSADERTYQLIRQVIGRVGRGHRPGTALIQTYNPDNPIIQAAVYGDYESFYRHELAARQKFNFPPARHMLKLTIGRASANSAEAACAKLKLMLEQFNLKIMIDGPSPCFHETKNGKHYWQLVLRANQRSELLAALSRVPVGTASELDPVSLL